MKTVELLIGCLPIGVGLYAQSIPNSVAIKRLLAKEEYRLCE